MPHLANRPASGHTGSPPAPGTHARPGRRPATSHEDIARVGLRLFIEHGFDSVSVDDIAAAAGVGRRTLFRYYPSKNDIAWGTFDEHLDAWERWIPLGTAGLGLLEAIRAAVVHFNSFDPQVTDEHRERMNLILGNPALQAHATLRYVRWRAVIARMVATRLDCAATDFKPTLLANLTLGAALSTYEQWLRDPRSDLIELMNEAFDLLGDPGGVPGQDRGTDTDHRVAEKDR